MAAQNDFVAPGWTTLPEAQEHPSPTSSADSSRDELDALSSPQGGQPRKRKGSAGSAKEKKKHRLSLSDLDDFARGNDSSRPRTVARPSLAMAGPSQSRSLVQSAFGRLENDDGEPPRKQYARKQVSRRARPAFRTDANTQSPRPTPSSRPRSDDVSNAINEERHRASSSSARRSDKDELRAGESSRKDAASKLSTQAAAGPSKPRRPAPTTDVIEISDDDEPAQTQPPQKASPRSVIEISDSDEEPAVIIPQRSVKQTEKAKARTPPTATYNDPIVIDSDESLDESDIPSVLQESAIPLERPLDIPKDERAHAEHAAIPVSSGMDESDKPESSPDRAMDVDEIPDQMHEELSRLASPPLESQLSDLAISPQPQVPVKGALYGGMAGFFKDMYSQKPSSSSVPATSGASSSSATKSPSAIRDVSTEATEMEEPTSEPIAQKRIIMSPSPPSLGDIVHQALARSTQQQVIDLTLSDDEAEDDLEQTSVRLATAAVGSGAKTEEVQEDRPPLSPSPPIFPSPSPSPAPMLPPPLPPPLPLPRSKLSDSVIAPTVEMDVQPDEKLVVDPMEDNSETEQVKVMLQEQEVTDEHDEEPQPVPPRRSRRKQRHIIDPDELAMTTSRSSSASSGSLTTRAEPLKLPRSQKAKVQAPSPRGIFASGILEEMEDMSINGIRTFSWATDRKAVAREFADFSACAADLPHGLEDEINALPSWARKADNVEHQLFEAAIRRADSVTGAPPIKIINHIDDDLTPPMEYHYTNILYHGDDVPLPDINGLQGCDCIGKCDPFSKTCSCVRRQDAMVQQAGLQPLSDGHFVWGPDGKLVQLNYPIVECNAHCNCDDDCQNRVVQHGRKVAVNIQKTEKKGWGIFAAQDIPSHTFIGVYSGEYLTVTEGIERGSFYDKYGRSYLFDIDFWYIVPEDTDPIYCIDAFHAGNFTRYLNHSCYPNCQIFGVYINESNKEKPLLAIFTCRDVKRGQELCFSYSGPASEDEEEEKTPGQKKKRKYKKRKLKANAVLDAVHVPCQCGEKQYCKGYMWRP